MSSDQSSASGSQSEHAWWRLNRKAASITFITAIIVFLGSVYALGSPSSTSKHIKNPTSLMESTTSTSIISNHPVGSGYLSAGSGYVAFIQWNNHKGTVSGTEEFVTINGQAPNLSTQSRSIEVSGTITGSTISLRFGSSAKVFGTFSGNSITIDIPQQDGTLAPFVYKKANATEFNSAVGQFDQEESVLNNQALQSQQTSNTEDKIIKDVKTVNADVADLNTSQLSSDSVSMLASLHQEAKALAATKTEEQKVLSEVNSVSNFQLCNDAEYNVGNYAIYKVASDAQYLVENTAIYGVAEDIQSLEDIIHKLKADFSQLQTARQTLPWFTPQGAPTQGQINQAISAISVTIPAAVSTTNDEISQANAYVTTAFQYVDQAYQAGNCGTPPTAPSPQKPIS